MFNRPAPLNIICDDLMDFFLSCLQDKGKFVLLYWYGGKGERRPGNEAGPYKLKISLQRQSMRPLQIIPSLQSSCSIEHNMLGHRKLLFFV